MKRYRRLIGGVCLLAILIFLGALLSNSLRPTSQTEENAAEQSEVREVNSIGDTGEENSGEIDTEGAEAAAFNAQPETVEAIEEIIASYKERLEREGQAEKPHWESAVGAELMPPGYECVKIDDDAEFGSIYYTFEEEDNIFDTQPTSLTEVEKLILAYEEEFRSAVETFGLDEALKVRKPHWKYAVKDAFMPAGYACKEMNGDEEFTDNYYTFSAQLMAAAAGWSGSGSEGDPYLISTPAQLKELADEVAAGNTFAGQWFAVTADLDMSIHSNWGPIGASSVALNPGYYRGSTYHPITGSGANAKVFSGNFDGRGHTISNLTSTGTGSGAAADYRGLFGITSNAVIKNVTVVNAAVTGGSGIGALIGLASGNTSIENCHVKNSSVKSSVGGTRLSVGGLIGEINFEQNNAINVLNCRATGTTVTSTGTYGIVGGLIGNVRSAAASTASPISAMNAVILINGCSVSGGSVSAAYFCVGGMIGQVLTQYTGGNTIELSDCTTDLPVETTGGTGYYVGGMLGQVWINEASVNNSVMLKNCHAYGKVTGKSYYVGGLAGFLEMFYSASSHDNSIRVEECSAHGNITGGSYFNGGLLGHIHNGVAVKNSWATGNVTGTSYGNGGLIGHSLAGGGSAYGLQCTITNSYATGHIKGSDYNGGLVGWDTSNNFKNCYATGSVNGGTTNGGLIGYKYGYAHFSSTIENCYATGTVLTGTGGFIGAFAASGSTNTTIRNSFYDTTTTKKTASQAVGNAARAGVAALTTGREYNDVNGMINKESFADWNIKNNMNGAANGTGNESDPWYIDDKVTYPYLWYQYDGHTRGEVNYNLSTAKYSFTNGSVTGKHIAPRRADFLLSDAGTSQATYYNVKNSGARAVYFPYLAQNFAFGGQSEIRVPSDGSHSVANRTTPYSMGGMSATNIISFDPLPYAGKISDRTVYQEGVESTYTVRGDLVEYKITITNPSIRYEWLNVILKDPLPEGVTLVEGLYEGQTYGVNVKINEEETAAIPKNAAEAGSYYYTYTKATGDGESDEPLIIYLGDFPTAVQPDDGGIEMYVAEVTFTALIDRRAVSQFPLNENIAVNGDNIRNTGTVNGTIREAENHSNTFPYETDFDDRNTDPVCDAYKVFYIGNGGKTADGAEMYEEYYLYDENFTVYGNQGTPFQFSRRYHLFQGQWYSRANPGAGDTVVYEIGRTYGLSGNQNTIGPGQRDAADEVDNLYEDYYALTDYKLYARWIEQKGSVTINKENENGERLEGARFLLEKQDGSDWIPLKWDGTAGEWVTLPSGETYTGETGSDGQLILGKSGSDNTLPFGTYRLIEVKSPSGYSLLREPIIIELPYEKTAVTDPEDGWDAKYVNDEGDTVYSYFNLNYVVTNVGVFMLPAAGNGGIPWYTYAGIAILVAAAAAAIMRYRHIKRSRTEAE